MGNEGSKQQQQSQTIIHSRSRKYKIIIKNEKQGNQKRKYMQINCPIYTIREYEQWQRQKSRIQNLNHSLFLPSKYQFQQDSICGTAGNLKLLFEFYPFILSEEINNRNKLKSPFSQQQIWYILYEIVCSSKQFQLIGTKSGDIRPNNIVINQDGQIKLINKYTFPYQSTNYTKAFQQKVQTYLSPQELSQLQKNIAKSTVDPILAQTFSIGLTILDIGLLFNSETLYDMNNLTFKNHLFNENIEKWKNSNYSNFLIKTVLNMIQINYIQRPTPGEVHAILQPYEQSIRGLSPFTPNKDRSKQNLQNYQKYGKSQQPNIKTKNVTLQSTSLNKINKSQSPIFNNPPQITNPHFVISQNKTPQISYNISLKPKIQQQIPYQNHQNKVYRQPSLQIYDNRKIQLPVRVISQTSPSFNHPQYIPPPVQHIQNLNQPVRVVPNSKVYLQQPDSYELYRGNRL